MSTPGHMCEKCHRVPADLPDSVLCSGCRAEENGVADLTSSSSGKMSETVYALAKLIHESRFDHAVELLKCAEADLQGILPEFEPSGERTHPAWKTLEEITEFLKAMKAPKEHNADGSRFENALEACRALVSAHAGEKHGELIDYDELDYARDLAWKVVRNEEE